jgi:serine/threonine protein kinase
MSEPHVTQPVPPPGPATGADGKYHVKEVAGFELVGTLGEGGMGKVFKARQRSIDRLVALKVLTPKLSEDRDYVNRFEREAKAAGKLSHPHIVAVIDRGEDKTGPKPIRWIAFEFIDGTSLEGRIKKGRLPEREALKIVRDIAEALRYSSEKGLIHRDVKPDNILLTADGTPKLADLGLAKFENDNTQLTQTGIVMGTPHYMAPEQALGERDLDVRADIYALGLVFYRCLTGELPWTATSALAVLTRHINEDCPDPRATVHDVSEPVVALLRRMTMRDRSARARPEEVILTATAILTGASHATTAPPRPPKKASGNIPTPVAPSAPPAHPAHPPKHAGATAPPHKPTSLKTASSGRAHHHATANGAPRKTTSAVHNTLVSSGPVPPGSQSRAALIVAFLGCMVLAALGTWAFDHRRRAHKAHDGSVATVPSDSGGTVSTDPTPPPPPPVETKPAEQPPAVKTPTPVEKPPAKGNDAPPALAADDAKRIDDLIMHASKIAVDDGQNALDDLDAAIVNFPAARVQLQDAKVLLGFVAEANHFLNDPEAKPEVGKDITARFFVFAKKPRSTDPVSNCLMAEIRGWDNAFALIGRLHDYLRGEGPPPAATHSFADGKTGVAAGYGEQWNTIATRLVPAVHEFETGDAAGARRNADAVVGLTSAIFTRAREAAKYLAALAEVRAANSKLTAIDALELVKGADTLFSRRLVRYDLTKADIPDRLGSWDWESGVGIVPPVHRAQGRFDGVPLGMLAPGSEVHVRISYKKQGLAVLTGGRSGEVLDRVLLVPELKKLATANEEHRSETEATMVFELAGLQGEVRVREGSKILMLDHGLEENFLLHGRNITVKEITYFRCPR